MCYETSAIFSCGHKTTRREPCSTATGLRTSDGSCNAVMTYPPRQREDPCPACWTKQMGMIEVSDTPKGKDDLPRSNNPCTPARHSRRMFRSFAPSGDPAKDAATLFWTPQGHFYDPERKKWALQRSKMPRPEQWKAMRRQGALKPTLVPAPAKKNANAPKQKTPQPKAKSKSNSKGKK